MNELTVAICAYNCEDYIKETLSCIINQTFQKFDLIILNDCSTDNSKRIIEKFFIENPRQYKLIDFDENKGLAFGRHFVENSVQTKYILFIDADDCPYPKLVEKLYNKISSDEDLMVVGCYLEFMDSKGGKLPGGQYLGDKTKEEFYSRAKNNKLIFLASNAIFDREIAISVGSRSVKGFFDGKPRYQDLCEDLDLWTRMSDLYTDGKAIVVLPEVLMRYRKHDQGLSASSFNMTLRIRHIKSNLLLRRAGYADQSFVNFYKSLTLKDIDKIRRTSESADCFRNASFFLKKGKLFKFIKNILLSFIIEPKYLWQKLKNNSGLLKKLK